MLGLQQKVLISHPGVDTLCKIKYIYKYKTNIMEYVLLSCDGDIITKTKANSLSEAIDFFSKTKKLTSKVLLTIFDVKKK